MFVGLLSVFLGLFSPLHAAIDARGLNPPAPAVYEIEAYLDEPPRGMRFVEEILVGNHGQARILYIVSYRRLGGGDPWDWIEDRHIYAPDFNLIGRPGDVDRVLEGPPGGRVRGRCRPIRSAHSLLIDGIEFPEAPGAAVTR
jgi:hypothetical protein